MLAGQGKLVAGIQGLKELYASWQKRSFLLKHAWTWWQHLKQPVFCLSHLRKVEKCVFSSQHVDKLWHLCVTFRPRCEVLPVTLWVAFALYIPLGFINAARWIVHPCACRWSPSWVYTYMHYPGFAKWVICVRHISTQVSQCPVISTFEFEVAWCNVLGNSTCFFKKITVVNHGSLSPSATSAAVNLLESRGFEYQTLLTFTAKSGCVWNSCESLEHGACRIGSWFCWVEKNITCLEFLSDLWNSIVLICRLIQRTCGIWPSLFTQNHMKWFNKSFHLIMAKQGAWKDCTFWGICNYECIMMHHIWLYYIFLLYIH